MRGARRNASLVLWPSGASPAAMPSTKAIRLSPPENALPGNIFILSEHVGNENLQPDADKDDAAQDGRLAGKLGAELLADVQARHADEESHRQ